MLSVGMVLALADMLLAKCLLLYKYNELCIGENGAFLAWAFLPISLAPIGRAAKRLPLGNGGGAGTLESGIKCLPWHFIPQVSLRKLASLFC